MRDAAEAGDAVKTFPLEAFRDAYTNAAARKAVGKVVVVMEAV